MTSSLTASYLQASLLTQAWLQQRARACNIGAEGLLLLLACLIRGHPARSKARWQVQGQSNSALHFRISKINHKHHQNAQSHSKVQFPAVIFLAAGFSQGHKVNCIRRHSCRTAIPLPRLMHFHLSTSARQRFAFIRPSLQWSYTHYSTSSLLHAIPRLPSPKEITCHLCSCLTERLFL